MNAKIMPLVEMRFNCAPVATEPRETFHDPDIGDVTVGPMPEPGEPEQGGALVICDSELGDLVCSPAAPGNPRRTLAPPAADLARIVFVFFSVLAGGLAVAGVLHHG